MLMLEIPTGYLYYSSLWLTPDLSLNASLSGTTNDSTTLSFTKITEKKVSSINILGALTAPLTKRIIQVLLTLKELVHVEHLLQ